MNDDVCVFSRADIPYRFLRRLNMDTAAPPRSKHGNKLLAAYPDDLRGTNAPRASWKHFAQMGRWSRRRLPSNPNK